MLPQPDAKLKQPLRQFQLSVRLVRHSTHKPSLTANDESLPNGNRARVWPLWRQLWAGTCGASKLTIASTFGLRDTTAPTLAFPASVSGQMGRVPAQLAGLHWAFSRSSPKTDVQDPLHADSAALRDLIARGKCDGLRRARYGAGRTSGSCRGAGPNWRDARAFEISGALCRGRVLTPCDMC
jgi:hypothetical protein